MKIILGFLLLIGLSSCGLHPMYGQYGTNPDVFEQVSIDTIQTKHGVEMRNALIDKLYLKGKQPPSLYNLKVYNLRFSQEALGLDKDSIDTTRYQLLVFADYTLKDMKTGKILHQNKVRSFVAYNSLDSQFTTIVARNDAFSRGIEQVADRIVLDLTGYFGSESFVSNQKAQKP